MGIVFGRSATLQNRLLLTTIPLCGFDGSNQNSKDHWVGSTTKFGRLLMDAGAVSYLDEVLPDVSIAWLADENFIGKVGLKSARTILAAESSLSSPTIQRSEQRSI